MSCRRQLSFFGSEDPSLSDWKDGGEQWCWPLVIYVILVAVSFLGILISENNSQMKQSGLVMNFVVAILVGLILYWLCKNGNVGLAWAVLLLPLVIVLLVMLIYVFGVGMGFGISKGKSLSEYSDDSEVGVIFGGDDVGTCHTCESSVSLF